MRKWLIQSRGVIPTWGFGIFLVLAFLVSASAGTALPSAPLPLFNGGTLNLQSLEGKVVVIRFLASW